MHLFYIAKENVTDQRTVIRKPAINKADPRWNIIKEFLSLSPDVVQRWYPKQKDAAKETFTQNLKNWNHS